MEMDDAPGLLSMPLVVLTHIGRFLGPRLLYDVSALCLDLRTAFNTNSIWRRHTQGGLVGRLLEHTPSLVEPTLSIPAHDTLDPLCDQRLHFIRQSRLLHNLRQGRYVHRVVNGPKHMGFHLICPDHVTYKSDYMLVAGYAGSPPKTVIFVYNIREEPQLVTTFQFGEEQSKPPNNHFLKSFKLHVVGNKLVIRDGKGFYVHEINLPSATFPLVFSCNWSKSPTRLFDKCLFSGKCVVIKYLEEDHIETWNVDTAEKIVIKGPEAWGKLGLLNVSSEGLILLSFIKNPSLCVGSPTDVRIFDLNKQQFTFHVHLDYTIHDGVVGNNHVVLFDEVGSDLVFICDCETSNLIIKKSFGVDVAKYDEIYIINDCLVIPADESVMVFSLSGFELLYELDYPEQGASRLTVLRGIYNLLIIGYEVYGFEERRKLFTLEDSQYGTVINESFCKIITMDSKWKLHVYSFW